MKKFLPLLLLLSQFGFSLTIEHWQTKNGANVLFVQEKNLPMLDIRLTFDAASSRDGDLYGIAKITNALIGTKSKQHNEEEIINLFDDVGAQLSNDSLKDMSILSLRTLSKKSVLEKSVALFYEILKNPVFDEKIIARFKKQLLRNLEAKQQSPSAIASQALIAQRFKNHPYAHQSIGTKETLKQISHSDIVKFFKQYYVANNLNIALIGDISIEKAKQIAQKLSSAISAGQKPQKLAEVQDILENSQTFIKFPSKQSHLLIAGNGIKRTNKDYYALYLGNHIFGGNGLNSLLSLEVREKRGLSYSVYSYFLPMLYKGYFLLSLQTENKKIALATKVAKEEFFKFIAKKPSKKDVQDAKNNLVGSFALRTASNAKILTYLSIIGFYDLPLNYLSAFIDNIKKITPEDIFKAYQKLFNNNQKKARLIEIIVGDK
jgi:zinc protease